MSELSDQLTALGACSEAREWVHRGGYETLAPAWAACERGDWMLWLLGCLAAGPAESEPRKRLVLCACAVAAQALPHAWNSRPAAEECLRIAGAWACGNATIDDLRRARKAAYAAADAHAAAYAAAYADAAAAYAAAYAAAAADVADAHAAASAAADAAAYAARSASLRASADIVRRYYPEAPALPTRKTA